MRRVCKCANMQVCEYANVKFSVSKFHFLFSNFQLPTIIFLLLFYHTISGQTFVAGGFLTDTVKIGLPVKYILVVKHPQDSEVLFPDSVYSYEPFEWLSKTYFPTRTVKNVSTDSVVYQLVSYNQEPVQRLQLPVFLLSGRDCTAVFAKPDALTFKSAIEKNSETLQENLDYQPVTTEEEISRYVIFSGAGILSLLLIWSLFGRRIRRTFRLYQLSLQHRGFAGGFDRLQRRLKQENTAETVENAVILWKKYMEDLENKPFSTYTSKETLTQIPDEALAEALKDIDKVVYGQVISEQAAVSLQVLEDISLTFYRKKREGIKREFSRQ